MSDDSPAGAEGWEPRPVPAVSPETAVFWEGAAEGEFRLGHCPACDLSFFYPRARCPDCLTAAETVPAEGTGTVYSYSVPSEVGGWPEEHLPLVVAYVELTEGPRVVTNVVDCDPAALTIGDPVAVEFVPTAEDDVAVPVFRPVDAD